MEPSITTGNPRIYLPSHGWKVASVIVGCCQIGLAAFLTFIFLTGDHRADLAIPCYLATTCLIIGVIFIRGASKVSVTLYADAIRVHGLVFSTTLQFDEILGKRRRQGKNSTHTLLIPKDKRRRKIIIKGSYSMNFDDTYNNWLASLPDLDATEKEKRRAAGKLHIWEQ